MNKKFLTGMILVMMLPIFSSSNNALAAGKISESDILLPYVNFNTTDVTLDGAANEADFFTFTITTSNNKEINVAFRHNGETIHAVLTSNNAGWVAMGWHNAKPASETGAGPMVDANIIIGGSNTARDDTGVYGNHNADTTNNLFNYSSTVTSSGAKFEFLFPLASSDPKDQPLEVKNYGYFIFATGVSANVADAHDGELQSRYVPGVYIESSDKEGFQKTSGGSAPFADPIFIVASLAVVAIITKLKKR